MFALSFYVSFHWTVFHNVPGDRRFPILFDTLPVKETVTQISLRFSFPLFCCEGIPFNSLFEILLDHFPFIEEKSYLQMLLTSTSLLKDYFFRDTPGSIESSLTKTRLSRFKVATSAEVPQHLLLTAFGRTIHIIGRISKDPVAVVAHKKRDLVFGGKANHLSRLDHLAFPDNAAIHVPVGI